MAGVALLWPAVKFPTMGSLAALHDWVALDRLSLRVALQALILVVLGILTLIVLRAEVDIHKLHVAQRLLPELAFGASGADDIAEGPGKRDDHVSAGPQEGACRNPNQYSYARYAWRGCLGCKVRGHIWTYNQLCLCHHADRIAGDGLDTTSMPGNLARLVLTV